MFFGSRNGDKSVTFGRLRVGTVRASSRNGYKINGRQQVFETGGTAEPPVYAAHR